MEILSFVWKSLEKSTSSLVTFDMKYQLYIDNSSENFFGKFLKNFATNNTF